jgi:hypothetical protein
MSHLVILDPVQHAARTLHPIQGLSLCARWVRLRGGALAVQLVLPSGGEGPVLALRLLEEDQARHPSGIAARVLLAVTGR